MYRVCDICGGIDEEPRHVIAGVIQDAYVPDEDVHATLTANIEKAVTDGTISMDDAFRLNNDFIDTTSQDRHMPCCARAGCPSGTCTEE